MTIAVIADIVGSRQLADREGAQRAIVDAIARVEHDRPRALQPLRATVGDELQGLYVGLPDALDALLLLQLALPEGVECRFGIGVGEVRTLEAAGGAVPDGPGWWAAREAVEHVEALSRRAAPHARTWVVGGGDEDADMHRTAELANAYLLARDHIVAGMSERARRLTYGRCIGRTQTDLAAEEGITQSAVSQLLSAAGAPAILAGLRAREEAA